MRSLIRGTLIGLAILAALLAALVWFVGPATRFALQLAGQENVRFATLRLGWRELEVQQLVLGREPGTRLDRLRVAFEPWALARGEVELVDLEGLVLRGRLADGRLELAGLETGSRDAGETAVPPIPVPQQVRLSDATVELDTPAGRLVLPLSGELRTVADHAEWSLVVQDARLVADPGTLARGGLRLDGQIALAQPIMPDSVSAEGTLTLRAEHAPLPDLALDLSGAGEIALALDGGRIEAATQDLRLEIAALGGALAPLGDVLPVPWRVNLGAADAPLRLIGGIGDEIEVRLDGPARLVTAQPEADFALALDLVVGPGGALHALRPSRATLDLAGLEWGGLAGAGRIELAAEGTPERLAATIALDVTGEGTPAPGVALSDVSLRQRLDVLLTDDTLTLRLPEPARLEAASLAWQEQLRTGPLTLRVRGADAPLLEADLRDGALGAWRETLVASLEPVEVTIGTDGAPLQLTAQADQLALRLEGDGGELEVGRASLEGGRVGLPGSALVLEGIATEAALDRSGLARDQTIPLRVGTIRHEGTPPWFAPLTASATLRPTVDQLGFDGRLRRIDGQVELAVAGLHDLTTGRGRTTVDLAPVTFAPGGLQPAAVSPAYGGLLSNVAGTLALDGSVRWQPGAAPAADLAVLIDQLAFGIGPARFEQVNGVVRFDQLWPVATLPGQQLAVGLVDLGLPLTRGFATFRLEPDGTLAVEQLRWRFAGGVVRAEPFTIGSGAADFTVTLRAEALDLSQLFALTRLEGLTGEGTINGVLPIRISGGEAVVSGGELVATRPGRLRYRPAEPPAALEAGGGGMDLLLEALENFRYEALRITLDGRTDAAMDIGLHLEGANPDLYDGYPIEFNLSLEGELANVLRQGLTGYQVPDQIRERIQDFPR